MERYVVVDNVCGWPKLTLMDDGSINLDIHNLHSAVICTHNCKQIFNTFAVFYVNYIYISSDHMLSLKTVISKHFE